MKRHPSLTDFAWAAGYSWRRHHPDVAVLPGDAVRVAKTEAIAITPAGRLTVPLRPLASHDTVVQEVAIAFAIGAAMANSTRDKREDERA